MIYDLALIQIRLAFNQPLIEFSNAACALACYFFDLLEDVHDQWRVRESVSWVTLRPCGYDSSEDSDESDRDSDGEEDEESGSGSLGSSEDIDVESELLRVDVVEQGMERLSCRNGHSMHVLH